MAKNDNDITSHAPRERVSWNFSISLLTHIDNCHAPRERVSWNLRFVLTTWKNWQVTLHVSVWVEMLYPLLMITNRTSRSTWACELKFMDKDFLRYAIGSRSTWACELKCIYTEIRWRNNGSRSTWACELKWNYLQFLHRLKCHAPRERVSWNVTLDNEVIENSSHAPRERVSWNVMLFFFAVSATSHAPRERVSWNIFCRSLITSTTCHAPRERVSWNEIIYSFYIGWNGSRSTWACELKLFLMPFFRPFSIVTLHVSVWVEIWNERHRGRGKRVTLHVSVWVEITRSLWNVSLCRSRSTWACELK